MSKSRRKKRGRFLRKSDSTAAERKAFYSTQDWRRLRYRVLLEDGAVCILCGRNHAQHGVVIHVDHIEPLSLNWSRRLDRDNLQILCEDCNLGKSNLDNTDFRPASSFWNSASTRALDRMDWREF